MGIGLTEEHHELQRSIAGTVERLGGTDAGRFLTDLPEEVMTSSFETVAGEGWFGLGIPEASGGQGGSVADVVILAEEFGRSLFPGPTISSLIVASVLVRSASDHVGLLGELANGTLCAATSMHGHLQAKETPEGLVASGRLDPVVGATIADLLLATVILPNGGQRVVLLKLDDASIEMVTTRTALDVMRRPIAITVTEQLIDSSHVVDISPNFVRDVSRTLVAAENCGIARACLEVATAYAKERVQFGRPIGQFQGVKHRLASLLVAVEQLTAAVWDASLAID
ncbi:MAG: acyl-CoA dehydrogenase family protein, partial [Actinomycetota bacterium]